SRKAKIKAIVPYLLFAPISQTPSPPNQKKSPPPSTLQPGTTILTLNKMCQENANSRPYTACVAYLRGLFDGMQQALENTFCPPGSADTDQLRLIVEGWVFSRTSDSRYLTPQRA